MNSLSADKKLAVLSALVEGNSIHSHLQDIRDVLASRRDKGNSSATRTDD
jgi:hypothetical protein